MKNEGRGSSRMLSKYMREPRMFRPEDLDRIVSVFEELPFDLDDYFPEGQPDPEILYGKVRMKGTDLQQFITAMIDVDGVRVKRFDVFPIGVPDIEQWLVNFELTPSFGH